MFYQEYRPHPNLTNFIKCYWLWEIPASPSHDEGTTVLTEGFEFSFNLADPLEVLTQDRKSIVENRSFVIGPMTQPIRIRPTRRMKIFGICFRPGGAYPFFPHPAKDFTNGHSKIERALGTKSVKVR